MKIIFDSGLEMVIPKGKEQFVALTVMELLGARDGSMITAMRPRAVETQPRKAYRGNRSGSHWRVWTESDDKEAMNLKSLGMPDKLIGKKLDRTSQAIGVRLSVLRKRGVMANVNNDEVDTPLLDRIGRVTAESQE